MPSTKFSLKANITWGVSFQWCGTRHRLHPPHLQLDPLHLRAPGEVRTLLTCVHLDLKRVDDFGVLELEHEGQVTALPALGGLEPAGEPGEGVVTTTVCRLAGVWSHLVTTYYQFPAEMGIYIIHRRWKTILSTGATLLPPPMRSAKL